MYPKVGLTPPYIADLLIGLRVVTNNLKVKILQDCKMSYGQGSHPYVGDLFVKKDVSQLSFQLRCFVTDIFMS